MNVTRCSGRWPSALARVLPASSSPRAQVRRPPRTKAATHTRVAVVPRCTCQEAGRHVPYQARQGIGQQRDRLVLPECSLPATAATSTTPTRACTTAATRCSKPGSAKDSRPASTSRNRHRPSAQRRLAGGRDHPTDLVARRGLLMLDSTRRPADQQDGSVPTIKAPAQVTATSLPSLPLEQPELNQGSPKPNGTYPGHTTKVTGSYNPSTHRYTLTGEPDCRRAVHAKLTGEWHLTGTFHAPDQLPSPTPCCRGERLAECASLSRLHRRPRPGTTCSPLEGGG